MTKKEFLDIIYKIQFELISIFEVESPNELPLSYCSISDNKLYIDDDFEFENKEYPFKTYDERLKTCNNIRKILKSRDKNYGNFVPIYGLHPYPIRMITYFPKFIFEYYGTDRGEYIISINSECLFNKIEKEGNISDEFNKTLYELHRNKTSKKYVVCRDLIVEKFEDKEIIINSTEYNNIPLIYDDSVTNKNKQGKRKLTNIITQDHPDARWEDILFLFPKNEDITSDSRIGIKYKGENRYNYFDFKELHLIKNNGKPMEQWTVLSSLVLDDRIKSSLEGKNTKELKLSPRITRLKQYLKKFTGINEEPFLPFNTKDLWKPKFRYKIENADGIKLQQANINYETKRRAKKMEVD